MLLSGWSREKTFRADTYRNVLNTKFECSRSLRRVQRFARQFWVHGYKLYLFSLTGYKSKLCNAVTYNAKNCVSFFKHLYKKITVNSFKSNIEFSRTTVVFFLETKQKTKSLVILGEYSLIKYKKEFTHTYINTIKMKQFYIYIHNYSNKNYYMYNIYKIINLHRFLGSRF